MAVRIEPISAWLHCHGEERPLSRQSIASALAGEGVRCQRRDEDPNSTLGLFFFDKETPDLIEFIQNSSQDGLYRVLVVATHKTALSGNKPWKLMQAGASDVVAWDASDEPAATIAARLQRWKAVDDLVNSPVVRDNLVGRSRAWVMVLRQVIELARYTDASVLITGESGTGKELIARLIHTLDTRINKRKLVTLDCTTVVPDLSGSEFFGHERGAFTHAVASRDGAFALADRGSLFLDEVGELPLPLQAELLRIVQERTYKRIGSNDWKRVNFRLICATNRNLQDEQARGTFRLDFYHRIASWTCKLPSLNERRDDIIPLTQHFLGQMQAPGEIPKLDSAVRDYLLLRDYPGNVRDLRQLVTRMAKRHVGRGPITVGDIPEDENPFAAEKMGRDWKDTNFQSSIRHALALGVTLKQISNSAAEVAIRVALEDEMGNLQRAAKRLGVTDRALQMRRASTRGSNGSGRAARSDAATNFDVTLEG
jgi:transcriptional regulator with GAF, ATPase, and Fis domain